MVNSVNCVWEAGRDLHGNDLKLINLSDAVKKKEEEEEEEKKKRMSRINIAQSGAGSSSN